MGYVQQLQHVFSAYGTLPSISSRVPSPCSSGGHASRSFPPSRGVIEPTSLLNYCRSQPEPSPELELCHRLKEVYLLGEPPCGSLVASSRVPASPQNAGMRTCISVVQRIPRSCLPRMPVLGDD